MLGKLSYASAPVISLLRNIIFTAGDCAEEVAYRYIVALERVPPGDTSIFPGTRVIVASGGDVGARPIRLSCLPTKIDGIAVDIRYSAETTAPVRRAALICQFTSAHPTAAM